MTFRQAAGAIKIGINAPLRLPVGNADLLAFGMMAEIMGQEFADIETDTAGADNRHILANGFVMAKYIEIAEHLGMINAVNGRSSRLHTGGDHDIVETLRLK